MDDFPPCFPHKKAQLTQSFLAAEWLTVWALNNMLIFLPATFIRMLQIFVIFQFCETKWCDRFHLFTIFSDINISQRSVATCLRWGGIFNDRFIANFSEHVTVKEFWKSASIWRSLLCRLHRLRPTFLAHTLCNVCMWSAPNVDYKKCRKSARYQLSNLDNVTWGSVLYHTCSQRR